MRTRIALAGLLAAIAPGFLLTQAAASPQHQATVVPVHAEFTERLSSVDGFVCAGLAARSPGCRLAETGSTTYTGTLSGVSDWEITGTFTAGGRYRFEGIHRFAAATIEGCGAGGLDLLIEGTIAPRPDPGTPLAGQETWQVRQGSGTGGLATVGAGGGEGDFTFTTSEINGETWVRGTLTGTVTCGAEPPGRGPRTEVRTIAVRAEYTEPLSDIDGVQCRGLAQAPRPPDCRNRYVGPVTFTGTISGDAYYQLTGPTPEGYDYEGFNHFEDAVIEGCGRGSFDLADHQGKLLFDQYDPMTNTLPGYNTWSIVGGSGGLAGLISGGGENHWQMYWSETGTERWGRGVFTGTITCAVPVDEAHGHVANSHAAPPARDTASGHHPQGRRPAPAAETATLVRETETSRLASAVTSADPGSLGRTGGLPAAPVAGAVLLVTGLLARVALARRLR